MLYADPENMGIYRKTQSSRTKQNLISYQHIDRNWRTRQGIKRLSTVRVLFVDRTELNSSSSLGKNYTFCPSNDPLIFPVSTTKSDVDLNTVGEASGYRKKFSPCCTSTIFFPLFSS